MDEILSIVAGIFRSELEDETLKIDFTSSPNSIEKWDSINNLVLLNAIEDTFKVTFPIEVIFKMENVGDICKYVHEQVNRNLE